MKIETNQNENLTLKSKIEKFYANESGSMFKELMDNGLISFETMPQNLFNDASSLEDLSSFVTDTTNLKASYKYDCLTMDRDDALFFANAIKGENYGFTVNGQVLMENMANDVQSVAKTYKSAEVSKTLADMLANSQSTNKPVRIDFGNDISAILRVSREGKISAEFIPSDKVAEEYLKNNISYLQQTFEEKDIPYNELSYRQQNRNKQQRSNAKESKGE